MHIVPAADSTATPPPDSRIARRMARVDGCPTACGNYVPPRITRDAPEDGFLAYYVCEDCGHDWITSWADEED